MNADVRAVLDYVAVGLIPFAGLLVLAGLNALVERMKRTIR